MDDQYEIVDVNPESVSEHGLFCRKSRKKSEGYQRKVRWITERFKEGLKYKMVRTPKGQYVGFIEYIPGEFAWRNVEAKDYMVIHCLWVVGRNRGKGLGSLLLKECIQDAKKAGLSGVAMVTSSRPWLADKSALLRNGFEVVDEAPPTFELLAKKLKDGPSPSFKTDWSRELSRCGSGLTVFRSDQCPFIGSSVRGISEGADELDIKTAVVDVQNTQDAQRTPTAYGVFAVVHDGELLTYRPIAKKDLLKCFES